MVPPAPCDRCGRGVVRIPSYRKFAEAWTHDETGAAKRYTICDSCASWLTAGQIAHIRDKVAQNGLRLYIAHGSRVPRGRHDHQARIYAEFSMPHRFPQHDDD